MGNPHAIFWVEDVDAYDLARIGPLLENHPIFPERANISLAHVIVARASSCRTWERGAGLTKACGSAACAAAVCAARTELHRPHGDGDAAGRRSDDRVARRDDHVLMTGPVALEYEGRFDPPIAVGDAAGPRCRHRGPVSVDVVTFGCRLNAYESEVIRTHAAAAGLDDAVSSTPAR